MEKERWLQIKAILEDAEGIPEVERRTWLSNRCGDDEELINEVSAFLSLEELETSDLKDRFLEISDEMAKENHAGQEIGTWKLIRELGAGGMGSVWLANRTDSDFYMSAAIKFIKTHLSTGKRIACFKRERQLLADMKHPHIAMLLDAGTTDQDQPYFVMEYIEGALINA